MEIKKLCIYICNLLPSIHLLLDVSIFHVRGDVELGILLHVSLAAPHQVLRDSRQRFTREKMRALAANVRPFLRYFRFGGQPPLQWPHVAIAVQRIS